MSSVYELCGRALRRERHAPAVWGPVHRGPAGESVRFGTDAAGRLEYEASTCATLLAACEWLLDHPDHPDAVYEDLKGVPESKLPVVALAVEALRAAEATKP